MLAKRSGFCAAAAMLYTDAHAWKISVAFGQRYAAEKTAASTRCLAP
jgi:hypothetical protein